MRVFLSLVGIFLRDLIRRRFLWVLVIVMAGALGITHLIQAGMESALGNGASWDLASRQQSARLDEWADQIRGWVWLVVVLFAAQVAPESRRNGTTQFVLSLGVPRALLAVAQFAALALLLTVGTLILHAGFSVAAWRIGAMTGREILFGWLMLLGPLLASAACALSLALTASGIETCLVFLGIPVVTSALPRLASSAPEWIPLMPVRALENLNMLFPDYSGLVVWPHLNFGGSHVPPLPHWGWYFVHTLAATAFWVILGLWLQQRHDFGSRTAVK